MPFTLSESGIFLAHVSFNLKIGFLFRLRSHRTYYRALLNRGPRAKCDGSRLRKRNCLMTQAAYLAEKSANYYRRGALAVKGQFLHHTLRRNRSRARRNRLTMVAADLHMSGQPHSPPVTPVQLRIPEVDCCNSDCRPRRSWQTNRRIDRRSHSHRGTCRHFR